MKLLGTHALKRLKNTFRDQIDSKVAELRYWIFEILKTENNFKNYRRKQFIFSFHLQIIYFQNFKVSFKIKSSRWFSFKN